MLGCKYEWCKTVPKITYAQYYVGVFLTNSGFPFCMALTASIFSKLLTGIPQVNGDDARVLIWGSYC